MEPTIEIDAKTCPCCTLPILGDASARARHIEQCPRNIRGVFRPMRKEYKRWGNISGRLFIKVGRARKRRRLEVFLAEERNVSPDFKEFLYACPQCFGYLYAATPRICECGAETLQFSEFAKTVDMAGYGIRGMNRSA